VRKQEYGVIILW